MAKRQQIKELNEKISLLREEKDKLEAETGEWAQKRDRLNERFRKIRMEISELKRERDEANERVKDLKLNRDEVKARIQQRIQELKNLSGEIKTAADKRPSGTQQALQQQFDEIEWKIQTNPTSLQEERELIEQVRQVETQLNIYKRLEQLRQKGLSTRAEIKALRVQGQSYHDILTKTAQKSQECHEKMISKIEESKRVKAEADSLHQTFMQTRERTRPIQEEIVALSDQIRQVKGEVRQKEEEEKKQAEGAILSELESRARNKLKRREKLTWEEFQQLAEKGIDTEDNTSET